MSLNLPRLCLHSCGGPSKKNWRLQDSKGLQVHHQQSVSQRAMPVDSSKDFRESRDHRDVLRFIYQTTAKGRGKSFPDWMQSWRSCLQESSGVQANSTEGTLT